MEFQVTYRDKNGAMANVTFEAESRTECLAQIRVRGILPISVKEVAKEKELGYKERWKNLKGKKVFLYAFLIFLFLFAACVIWWWMAQRGNESIVEPKRNTISTNPASTNFATKSRTENIGHKSVCGLKPDTKKTMANGRMPEEKSHEAPIDDMSHDVVSDLRVDLSRAKPMFENTIHAELANYIQPGRDVPPPDRMSDEDALKAADTQIKYGFADPIEILEQKKAVEDLLLEMKTYIKNGGHANDFLEKLQQRQEMEGEAVSQVRRNVYELIEKGDDVAAQEALDTYNRYLQGKGIPPVRIKRLERTKASEETP